MKFNKSWGIWLGLAIVVIFSLLVLGSAGTAPGKATITLTNDSINPSDHVLGSPGAKVTLIEYSDYQCPACALYAPLVAQLAKDFPDQLVITVRQFPLRQIHRNADASAQAAEAAAAQGRFWEMNDLLYSHQREWEGLASARETFKGYARDLGLDEAQFVADSGSAAVKDKIESDLQSGLKAGLNGTPTFFVNGSQIVNPRSYDAFKFIIQSEVNK